MNRQVASRTRRGGLALPRIEMRVAVGALVAVAAIVVFLQMQQQAQITEPVVVAARDLPAGHLIEEGDLTVSDVRLDSTLASLSIPAAEQAFAVGRTTVAPVHAGALVLRPDLGVGPVIGPDEVAVTVPLRTDEAYPRLRPGDRVTVVSTTGDLRSASGSETVLDEATILHVSAVQSRTRVGGSGEEEDRPTNVTLIVPATAGERLARAIVTERVTLLFLGAPSEPSVVGSAP